MFLAAIMMVPTIYLKYRNEIKAVSKKNWVLAAISGLFLALHFILWFESLNMTSVASSVVLVTLQPIFAFIGTYFFFGERFSVAATISLIITMFGSVIIALRVAVTVTGYFLIGQQLRRTESLMVYTFIVYAISSLVLLVYNLILQNQFLGYSPTIWLWFFALAVIPTFLGHTLFNWAL